MRNKYIFEFESKFKNYCNKFELQNKSILIAVSGGIDSIALTNLLVELKDQLSLKLRIAHINHSLRKKESVRDQKFVEGLALKYNLPVDVLVVNIEKIKRIEKGSMQEVARNIRYKFLYEKAKKHNCEIIVTAHNMNDNAETLLLNLFRGSGIDGLSGIPPINYQKENTIIRPLLSFNRNEIVKYVKLKKLQWVEDSTNKKTKYKRNYTRHKLIPLIGKNYNPKIIETLGNTATLMQEKSLFINKKINEFIGDFVIKKPNYYSINKYELSKIDNIIQTIVLKNILEELKIIPSHDLINSLLNLLTRKNGTTFECNDKWKAQLDRGFLFIERKSVPDIFSYRLIKEGSIITDEWKLSIQKAKKPSENKLKERQNIQFADNEKITFPLIIRSWRKGDVFYPLGMHGKQKISDYFVNLKIPLRKKTNIPIVECDNKIIWVAGLRLDDRVKITDKTKNTIKMNIQYLNDKK